MLPGVLAAELGCALVTIRLADAIRGTIGDGEKAVRAAFSQAKKLAPSVIFIDEFQVFAFEIETQKNHCH